MARAHVEIEWTPGSGHDTWTVDDYERFMYGTGEWVKEKENTQGEYIYLPSGCYFISEQYTKPDDNGAVI